MYIATLKIILEEGIMDPVFFSRQEDMPTSWGFMDSLFPHFPKTEISITLSLSTRFGRQREKVIRSLTLYPIPLREVGYPIPLRGVGYPNLSGRWGTQYPLRGEGEG